jgi:hypothetical protein
VREAERVVAVNVAGRLRKGRRHGRTTLLDPSRTGRMGLTREHPGAEGPVRIAPPGRPSQGDFAILPWSIPSRSSGMPDRGPADEPADRLTPSKTPSYHPPDDERADALMWALGAFVCLMGSDVDPGPSGEDRAQSR